MSNLSVFHLCLTQDKKRNQREEIERRLSGELKLNGEAEAEWRAEEGREEQLFLSMPSIPVKHAVAKRIAEAF